MRLVVEAPCHGTGIGDEERISRRKTHRGIMVGLRTKGDDQEMSESRFQIFIKSTGCFFGSLFVPVAIGYPFKFKDYYVWISL